MKGRKLLIDAVLAVCFTYMLASVPYMIWQFGKLCFGLLVTCGRIFGYTFNFSAFGVIREAVLHGLWAFCGFLVADLIAINLDPEIAEELFVEKEGDHPKPLASDGEKDEGCLSLPSDKATEECEYHQGEPVKPVSLPSRDGDFLPEDATFLKRPEWSGEESENEKEDVSVISVVEAISEVRSPEGMKAWIAFVDANSCLSAGKMAFLAGLFSPMAALILVVAHHFSVLVRFSAVHCLLYGAGLFLLSLLLAGVGLQIKSNAEFLIRYPFEPRELNLGDVGFYLIIVVLYLTRLLATSVIGWAFLGKIIVLFASHFPLPTHKVFVWSVWIYLITQCLSTILSLWVSERMVGQVVRKERIKAIKRAEESLERLEAMLSCLPESSGEKKMLSQRVAGVECEDAGSGKRGGEVRSNGEDGVED